jgi:hypothetical protein
VHWSTREGWTLGLFASAGGTPRPSYWAFNLYAAHFGPTLLTATSSLDSVRVYASRNQADTATQVIIVNWNDATANLTFQIDGPATPTATPTTVAIPSLSMAAVEIPDTGVVSALVYGEPQHLANLPPQPLATP